MTRLATVLAIAVLTLPFVATAPATASPPSQYYFAEGSTRPGFEETLWLFNSGTASITVTVEYQFGDGASAASRNYTDDAESQKFVIVNDEVGSGKDVSLSVSSVSPFTASRFMDVDT